MGDTISASIIFGYASAVAAALDTGWVRANDQVVMPCAGSVAWPVQTLARGAVPVPCDASWPDLEPDPDTIDLITGNRTRLLVAACPRGRVMDRLCDISARRDVPLAMEFTFLTPGDLEAFLEASSPGTPRNAIALVPLSKIPGLKSDMEVPWGCAWLFLTRGRTVAHHPDDLTPGPNLLQSAELPISMKNRRNNTKTPMTFESSAEAAEYAATRSVIGTALRGQSFGGRRLTEPVGPRGSEVFPYFACPELAARLRLEAARFPMLAASAGKMWQELPRN